MLYFINSTHFLLLACRKLTNSLVLLLKYTQHRRIEALSVALVTSTYCNNLLHSLQHINLLRSSPIIHLHITCRTSRQAPCCYPNDSCIRIRYKYTSAPLETYVTQIWTKASSLATATRHGWRSQFNLKFHFLCSVIRWGRNYTVGSRPRALR